MEFQISCHLQRGPIFILSCMYQLMLFLFYVRVFRIMGSRCSLFFVTFVFCPLHVLKYHENSHRFFEIQYGSSLNYLIVPLAFHEGFIFQNCKEEKKHELLKKIIEIP